MLKIAALVLASAAGAIGATASASSSDTLVSNSPWWEKITVTMSPGGKPTACRYETSLKATAEGCDVDANPASMATNASESKGEVTSITFERRFDPGQAAPKAAMKPGDTLLGGQIMALAIDARGAVKGCRVVSKAGEMQPQYGCDDASAERFQASMSRTAKTGRDGFMTILVYGHSEHMV